MLNERSTVEKIYWKIGDLAKEVGVYPCTIRFWQTQIPQINPKRVGNGERRFSNKEADIIRFMAKNRGFMTMKGMQKYIKDNF